MNPCSTDIAEYLKDELGYTPGTDLFISGQPITPTNIITIFDTSGSPPDTNISKESNLRDSIQIIVRNNSYVTAFENAFTIMNKLHATANITINGIYYLSIWLANGPNVLIGGTEKEKDRTLLSMNFNIIRKNN